VHPGQRIGKYVLGERIAVGGMAEVWAARAEGPEGFVKPVALKVILESFSGDPELEKLFIKEARIAAQLQHANLVSVFDFDKVVTGASEPGTGGRYYIAMEHVEGYDARRVAQAARHAGYLFPLPLALYLAGEVMKGLRYVHERRDGGRPLGLVHRDVSPHNVLVGFSGEVKLSDFGIAKSLAHSSRTKTGTIRGKIAYASPEQLSAGPVDHRTDQFAMGITLWEILADRCSTATTSSRSSGRSCAARCRRWRWRTRSARCRPPSRRSCARCWRARARIATRRPPTRWRPC
jgi:serine/threonine-protein kinase